MPHRGTTSPVNADRGIEIYKAANNFPSRVMEAIQDVGIVPAVRQDALARGEAYFRERQADRIDARSWAEGLRVTCPHFFPQVAPEPATAPASTAISPVAACGVADA